MSDESKLRVAAVCDKEARVYGPRDSKSQRRPLMFVEQFTSNGAAKLWAIDFDTTEKLRNKGTK